MRATKDGSTVRIVNAARWFAVRNVLSFAGIPLWLYTTRFRSRLASDDDLLVSEPVAYAMVNCGVKMGLKKHPKLELLGLRNSAQHIPRSGHSRYTSPLVEVLQ